MGYDYSSWYMNAGKLSGFRLVATITGVEAQDDVTWGRAQSTNHNKSGLYLPKDSNGDRQLLEAFVQPSTVFVERAYVLDYGKEFALSGWYFDPEDGKPAEALHLDCQIENGMNQFDEKLPTVVNGSTTGNTQYGNVRIENGRVYYQPTTMQWGGYDQFYVFGNTWRNTVLSQSANENGNLWNKVTVIPASNIYYEDTFETENESGGANAFSGFVFSEGWGTAYTDDKPANAGKNEEHPEHVEDSSYGGVHGWTDSLADDVYFSDGSAHVAGLNETMGAKATFTFTDTGVDIYTRTNQKSGIVVAKLSGQTQDGTSVSKSIFMDNLAMSGDYYQIPTLSFVNLDYGTYQVTLIATAASAVATGEKRYEYYVDGVRVYDPLGKVTQASDTVVKDAYGKEINGVYTEIRDIMIANNDFTAGLPHTGAIGAVFIDWIRDGQGTGSDVPGVKTGTYEVSTTFKTYGPKNEVYLAEGQAVVIKVDAQNTYYVGMKSITLGLAAKVNVSGLAMKDPQTITVGHSTDMYYEVTPIVDEETGDAYIVIQNASENDALLALTKLRTTNPHGDSAVNGVQLVAAAEAVSAMELYSEALEEAKTRPEEEAPETEKPVDPLAINQQQTSQLFANVRTWLEEEKEDVA